MLDFKEKYINPFTDYGFKRLFGEEPNKDLLLDFLNELLKEEQGKIEVAKKMILKGIDIPTISEMTGLTETEINSLKNEF
jgi:hypothetical protein